MTKYSSLTILKAMICFSLLRACGTFSNIDLSTQTLNPSMTGFMITGNAANDYFGRPVSTAGDINGDGYDDIIIGADNKNSFQGAVYVVYGGPKSTMTNIPLSTQTLNPTTTGFMITGNAANDAFGLSASTAGDINNDGYDDIIVGAPGKNNLQGAVYVIYGGPDSTMSNILLSAQTLNPLTTGFMITGNAASDQFGVSVSTTGDINNDGYDDIIVGAYNKNNYKGAAYVIYGGPKSTMTNIILSTQTLNPLTTGFMITGNAVDDSFGRSVRTAGDINKDGYDDIIIGADSKNSNAGAAYVIYGGPKSTMSNILLSTQTLNPATTGFMITGNASYYMHFGWSVSTAGDINNDGYGDIIVGAYAKNGDQGAAYVIYGGPKSAMTNILLSTQTLDPLTTGFMITGNAAGDELGFSVSMAGDINNDGYDDIIVGAYGKNSYQGAVYVIYACPTCLSCPTNCNTCTSASVCTGCTTPYLLYHAQCLSSCPAGTFVSTNTCQDCSMNCNTCTSASVCTGCTAPNLLYRSQCVSSCPAGTFLSTNTCQDCSTNCNACSGASVCTQCTAPYLLHKSQCVSSCPASTFVSTNKCQDCPTNCNTCTSASGCTQCTAPYLLYQSQCVSSCPAGTFVSTNTCQDCPSHCSACTSQNLCQNCDQGYILSNSLCDLSPSPSPSSSSQQTQGQATQAVSSSAKGIGSVVCVGRTAPPVAALVSKTVQNTRYLNLSVTAELAEIYQTWDTDMISWDVPTTFSNEDHFKSSPSLFARYGLSSPFLVNFWPTIMNIGISLTVFIFCCVLNKLFERAKYKGWIPFIVHKLLAGSFNFAFVQAYACLDDTLFYLVIDIKTNPFNGSFSWASITAAFTFLVVGCILVFLNFWTVSKYQRIKKQGLAKRDMKDLKDFNERNKYWEILYSDFNDDGFLSQSFFAILIIRSTLSSFIIVVFNYPLVQASILVALDVAIILFLYFKNPFNTLRGKLAQYYYEIITLLVHICTLILSLQDTLKNSSDKLMNAACKGVLYLNTALIAGSVGFMFIEIYKTIEKARDEKRKQRQNIPEDSQETQNRTRRVSPFQPLESDASNMQARINRDQSVSVENLYFFPGVNQNGNTTNYDLNMESSRDLNADTSRELYVNPSSRINQQTNQGTAPIIIRPRRLRMNQMQQRSRYIDTSHVENAGQAEHT